jgi:hypothetical protein
MKVRLLIATVVAVFLAAGASTVQAHLIRAPGPFKDLTLKEQAQFYERNAHHALAFLRPWNDIRHWQVLSHRHWLSMYVPEPAEVVYHRNLLRNSIRGLRQVQREVEDSLIPHKALWLCLHRHEAIDWYNRDTGHNGHYGGLQMTYRWLGLISGYAYNLTPFQQMLAAETGYRNSHYSYAWLSGQWTTLGYCTSFI